MNRHSKKPRSVQSHLAIWEPACRPSTAAGLHLTRRYRVDPAIADVVAGLAGLGAESGESIVATVKPEGSDI
jgi:hypothetical protein